MKIGLYIFLALPLFCLSAGTQITPNGDVSITNLDYVDSVNGSDSTGLVYRSDRPFLTIAAANAASSSGDTIVVLPGTYNEKNIVKNGRNYHLLLGAVVRSTTTTQGGIIDDSSYGQNGAIVSRITGSGQFIRQFSNSDTAHKSNVVNLTNVSSDVSIQCDLIQDATTGAGAVATWAIRQAGGLLSINANKIIGNGLVWWSDGPSHIVAQSSMSSSGASGSIIYSSPDGSDTTFHSDYTTGYLYVESQAIDLGTGTATLQGALSARTWIVTKGDFIGQISATGGRNYFSAQKLTGRVTMSGSNAELWVDLEKHANTGNAALIQPDGDSTAKLWYHAQHVDPPSASSSAVILALGGVSQISIDDLTTNSDINAFASFGGTVTINGANINASSATTSDAINIQGGTLNLKNCSITSASGKKDINRSSGTVNVINGRGTNADGTFTTAGTVNFVSTNLRKDANFSDISSASTARANLAVGHLVSAPSTASDTCSVGDYANDTGFTYICTATNTWKRVAIATW